MNKALDADLLDWVGWWGQVVDGGYPSSSPLGRLHFSGSVCFIRMCSMPLYHPMPAPLSRPARNMVVLWSMIYSLQYEGEVYAVAQK